jgi:hypothetical protein
MQRKAADHEVEGGIRVRQMLGHALFEDEVREPGLLGLALPLGEHFGSQVDGHDPLHVRGDGPT